MLRRARGRWRVVRAVGRGGSWVGAGSALGAGRASCHRASRRAPASARRRRRSALNGSKSSALLWAALLGQRRECPSLAPGGSHNETMADYGRWTTSSSAIGAYWRKKERQQKLEAQRRRQRAREVLAHQANKEYFDSNVLQRSMGLTTTKKGAQREAFAAAYGTRARGPGYALRFGERESWHHDDEGEGCARGDEPVRRYALTGRSPHSWQRMARSMRARTRRIWSTSKRHYYHEGEGARARPSPQHTARNGKEDTRSI